MTDALPSRPLRRALATLLSIAVVALSVAACDDGLRLSDYDQTCDQDSDCVPIQVGEASCCGFSDCNDNAAINKADFHGYLSDYQDATDGCTPTPCPLIACQTPPVACVSGKCQLLHVHLE